MNRNQALNSATILKSARKRFEKRPGWATSDRSALLSGFVFVVAGRARLSKADTKTKRARC